MGAFVGNSVGESVRLLLGDSELGDSEGLPVLRKISSSFIIVFSSSVLSIVISSISI